MTDREIFKNNLNYYLNKSGKLQKNLAEYVGAKPTTVSGWTRGISYPRADSMEKIAMFFGIPTSKLVGLNKDGSIKSTATEDPEISIVSGMMETMTKEQKQQVIDLVKILVKK